MFELLLCLFDIIGDPSTWGRSGLFFRGICGIVIGVLLLTIGTRGTMIVGSLFLTFGLIFILLGFARRESDLAAGKHASAASPVAWKPPDSADVNKIVGGK